MLSSPSSSGHYNWWRRLQTQRSLRQTRRKSRKARVLRLPLQFFQYQILFLSVASLKKFFLHFPPASETAISKAGVSTKTRLGLGFRRTSRLRSTPSEEGF